MSLEVNQVVKQYGHQLAVNEISFTVKKGEILGFLGPNGAGKSTTMKMATGYIPPDAGSISVLGIPVQENPIEVQKHIGYLPEHNPLYLDAYVHEYLHWVAGLQGVGRGLRSKRVKEVVELCGLTREQNKRISALSKGYRQRVGLAQALVHNPDVLILDEPTTGLDPNQIQEIREVISSIRAEKTIIFSTHIMQEVQALCDRVVIINRGKLVVDKPLSKLQQASDTKILKVVTSLPIPVDLLTTLAAVEQVVNPAGAVYQLHTKNPIELSRAFIQLAAAQNWSVLSLGVEEDNLEKIFKDLTLNAAQA